MQQLNEAILLENETWIKIETQQEQSKTRTKMQLKNEIEARTVNVKLDSQLNWN